MAGHRGSKSGEKCVLSVKSTDPQGIRERKGVKAGNVYVEANEITAIINKPWLITCQCRTGFTSCQQANKLPYCLSGMDVRSLLCRKHRLESSCWRGCVACSHCLPTVVSLQSKHRDNILIFNSGSYISQKKLMNYGNFDQTTSLSSVIVSHLSLAICWADREIYTNATQMQTRKCKQKSSDEHQLGREMVKTAAPRKSGWHALPK